ncbi:hypothetical protein QFZ68_000826 [Streptomyces sp. V1I6]|nr:hypothetical protein [Streptomyces sp. V1I6]
MRTRNGDLPGLLALGEGHVPPGVRDRLFDQRADEGLEDLVDRLAGLHRPPEVGASHLVSGGMGTVTAPGGVDGGHRVAARRCVPGPGPSTAPMVGARTFARITMVSHHIRP